MLKKIQNLIWEDYIKIINKGKIDVFKYDSSNKQFNM